MAAALEPGRWLGALDVMAREVGASHGQLIGVGGDRDVSFNLVTNFDTAALQEFVAMGGASPQLNYRVAAAERQIASGHYDPLVFERHYDEVITTLPSRRYVEWCQEIDIPFGCQANLVIDGFGIIGLAALRTRRDGRTRAADRATFARAAEAARRAVRLQERLEGEQARFLAGAFEAIGICAFLIDRHGRLLTRTARAEELLDAGDVTLANGQLAAPGRPLTLQQAIAALVSEDQGLGHVRLQIDRPADRAPLLFEGFRLPRREWSFGRLPRAVLIANPPRRDRAGVATFLQALYRLTGAEADIALRLVEGRSREQIQTDRSVTAETLKGQIKGIYLKCGVDGEASLMRLLAGIMA